MNYANLIPVNLVTGFLGSGKTTLLQRLLASPKLARTAVLVNEFGEVGLDHLLLQSVDEATVLLESGCICCTIRSDLSQALRDLFGKRERGEIPAFDRVAIETTGLADPAPIVSTLTADPVLRHHFRLGSIVTTVDAVNGPLHLAENPESIKQVAVADRLVLTKTDLCDRSDAERLKAGLRRLNAAAPIREAALDPIDPDELMASDAYDPDRRGTEVASWLRQERAEDDPTAHDHGPADLSRHGRDIASFCLAFDAPLDWTAFGLWLTMLLNAHGEKILRVKGIVKVEDSAAPVVLNGVQHVIHPPTHLDRWPDADRRSRLVFIVRDLDRQAIERSLAAFNGLARRDARPAVMSESGPGERTIAGRRRHPGSPPAARKGRTNRPTDGSEDRRQRGTRRRKATRASDAVE